MIFLIFYSTIHAAWKQACVHRKGIAFIPQRLDLEVPDEFLLDSLSQAKYHGRYAQIKLICFSRGESGSLERQHKNRAKDVAKFAISEASQKFDQNRLPWLCHRCK